MPAKPMLSDDEKIEIKRKLVALCEELWIAQGYRKTNVKSLCEGAKISVGTFYSLYSTKEDLFLETMVEVQGRLKEAFLTICRENPTKQGFIAAMTMMYKAYDEHPLLFIETPHDFQAFTAKLTPEALATIQVDSIGFFKEAIEIAKLQLKVDVHLAYGVFSALMATLYVKDALNTCYNYLDLHTFMLEGMVDLVVEP